MRAVDTNVLVRLMARDDERHTAAAEVFVTGGAWVCGRGISRSVLSTVISPSLKERRSSDGRDRGK